MVLGPEQVRLGQGPAWRGSRSTRPKGQVHRRRRARGVRRPRAARGAGCPQPGGSWPGRGTTARGRASGTQAGRESGSATRPASPHGDPGSVGRADPVIRPPGLQASPPPRLPLRTHLRRSSRGSRPGPGPAPEPLSLRLRESREGTRGADRGAARVAGARTAGPRARRPRRALSRQGRPRSAVQLPPPQPRPGPVRLAFGGVHPAPG